MQPQNLLSVRFTNHRRGNRSRVYMYNGGCIIWRLGISGIGNTTTTARRFGTVGIISTKGVQSVFTPPLRGKRLHQGCHFILYNRNRVRRQSQASYGIGDM